MSEAKRCDRCGAFYDNEMETHMWEHLDCKDALRLDFDQAINTLLLWHEEPTDNRKPTINRPRMYKDYYDSLNSRDCSQTPSGILKTIDLCPACARNLITWLTEYRPTLGKLEV